MAGDSAVTLHNLISAMIGGNFEEFKTSMCLATESRKYHSMQILLIEVWQYMEERGVV